MSPKEYSDLKYKFVTALEERLTKEGYSIKPEIIQERRHSLIIQVLNEAYEIFCDGERADWVFLGFVNK